MKLRRNLCTRQSCSIAIGGSLPPCSGQDGGIKMGSQPPALAPLAFCGLGTLGLLVCAPPLAKEAA